MIYPVPSDVDPLERQAAIEATIAEAGIRELLKTYCRSQEGIEDRRATARSIMDGSAVEIDVDLEKLAEFTAEAEELGLHLERRG
jgi:hypothetical protein